MGEARRRIEKGLSQSSKINGRGQENSPKIFSFLPINENQEKSFIQLTIKGAWFGIGILVFLWIVVRFVGPYFGWWIPADLK